MCATEQCDGKSKRSGALTLSRESSPAQREAAGEVSEKKLCVQVVKKKKSVLGLYLKHVDQRCFYFYYNKNTAHAWTVQNRNVLSHQCPNQASSLICAVRTGEQSEEKVAVCAPWSQMRVWTSSRRAQECVHSLRGEVTIEREGGGQRERQREKEQVITRPIFPSAPLPLVTPPQRLLNQDSHSIITGGGKEIHRHISSCSITKYQHVRCVFTGLTHAQCILVFYITPKLG